MRIFSIFGKLKNRIKTSTFFNRRISNDQCNCRNRDIIQINLGGLDMYMDRCMAYDKPHEITAVVPRAELRKKISSDNGVVEEIEVILNSITIVSSPQRPSHEGEGGGEVPVIPSEWRT